MSELKHTITILPENEKPVILSNNDVVIKRDKLAKREKVGHGGRLATFQQTANRKESG